MNSKYSVRLLLVLSLVVAMCWSILHQVPSKAEPVKEDQPTNLRHIPFKNADITLSTGGSILNATSMHVVSHRGVIFLMVRKPDGTEVLLSSNHVVSIEPHNEK